jgi:hypothetical protein
MKKPIAAQGLTNVFSIAILAIDEQEDKITSCFYNMDKQESVRTTSIFWDANDNAYFNRYRRKYFLSDFLRV